MKKNVLLIVNLCLVILLVVVCVNIFMADDEAPEVIAKQNDDTEQTTPDQPETDNTESTVDKETLDAIGEIFEENQGDDVKETVPTVTQLKLPAGVTLKGTVAGSPSLARAIFRDKSKSQDGKEFELKIDQELNGMTLVEIDKDYVIFTANGKELKVWIKEDMDTGNTIANKGGMDTGPEITLDEIIKPKTREVLIKTLDSLSMDSEWEVVKAQPGEEEIEGLKVINIKNHSPIALIGVRNNDIIKSINRQKLTDFKKTYQVLQKAKLQRNLSIVVWRDGKEITIESEINQ